MKLATSSPDDRAIRAAGAITAAFLVVAIWPMARWTMLRGEATPPLLHLAALVFALGTLALGDRAPRVVRDWMPLALGPFLYIELRWLIEGTGLAHADARVIGWEHALFGGDPSSTLAPRWGNRWVSEVLHLCYASYYLIVLVPPALLYLRGRRSAFAQTLLALAIVYAACFTTYLLFPVDGPRYLVGPAHAPEGPVRGFVLHLLAGGSSRGTAFPSSHVAASVVASLCALRSDRRIGIPAALLTAGLTVATVYGGFHYAVDALAGLVVGVASWALAEVLGRRMSAPGVQRATAA
jgi:membrane-associated phospholipid phosphatase